MKLFQLRVIVLVVVGVVEKDVARAGERSGPMVHGGRRWSAVLGGGSTRIKVWTIVPIVVVVAVVVVVVVMVMDGVRRR